MAVSLRDAPSDGERGSTSAAPAGEELLCRMDPHPPTSTADLDAACPVDCLREALAPEPSAGGDASMIQAMEQDPAWQVDPASNGLKSVDPSLLPASVVPKHQCLEDYGCEYQPKCATGGFIPDVNYLCFVTDCGPSKCSSCPDWVNDRLKSLVIKAWCAYVCVQTGTSPPKEVAIGAAGISALRSKFIGPFCLKEIPKP